jgi:hypothetical protein
VDCNNNSATVADIIACHARRNFGQTGFREITLITYTKGEAALSYQIAHIWKVEEGLCSSLYFIKDPPVLAGTAVKLVERPYSDDIEIWLRLRTAARPICIESSRSDQYLLGTDFVYDDLRFWLPTDAFDIKGLDLTETKCSLRIKRASSGARSSDMRLVLDRAQWLPLTIEWFDFPDGSLSRVYSAERLTCVDGIWTPRTISVSRPHEQYRSDMVLRRALYGMQFEPRLFSTEALKDLSKSDFEGWSNPAYNFVDQ